MSTVLHSLVIARLAGRAHPSGNPYGNLTKLPTAPILTQTQTQTLSFRLCAERWRNPCLGVEAIGKLHLGAIFRHGFRHDFVVKRNDRFLNFGAILTQTTLNLL